MTHALADRRFHPAFRFSTDRAIPCNLSATLNRAKTLEDMAASAGPSSSLISYIAPREPDSAARRHFLVAISALSLVGLLAAVLWLKLRYPQLLGTIPFWSYGRLRPVALNSAVFGWITIAYIGFAYYVTPRLTGRPLWGQAVAHLNLWLAVIVFGGGSLALALGVTDGRSLLEFPLWIDAVVAVVLLVPAVLVTKTVFSRVEEGLYVTTWYTVAGLWWLLAIFVVGNLPGTTGFAQALQEDFYRGTLTGLWLTGFGVGGVYYLVPKITGNPLFSRQLALVGFWSLAFAQVWAAAGSGIFGPAPEWIQTTSIALTVALIVPMAANLANWGATMAGAWDSLRSSYALRLALAGAVAYGALVVVQSVSLFRSSAAVAGLTTFGDALLFGTIFGTASFFAAALVAHALPAITGRGIFSEQLASAHIRATAVGVAALVFIAGATGVYSGLSWVAGVSTGEYLNTGEGFLVTLDALLPLYTLAGIAGLIVYAGQLAFSYNVWRSYTSGPPVVREALVEVSEGERDG